MGCGRLILLLTPRRVLVTFACLWKEFLSQLAQDGVMDQMPPFTLPET